MKTTAQQTEGASLFVVVLVVLLLLSAIMAVTAQITLASRRSTGEQETTLRAQYAADSAVARAQARISVLNNVLSNATFNNQPMGIKVPRTASSPEMEAYIRSLCNISGTLPLASQTIPVCGDPNNVNSNVLAGSTDPSSRLALFTASIDGTQLISDSVLAAAGGPAVGTDPAVKQAFWNKMFGGATGNSLASTINGMTTEGTAGAVVSSVWRLTADEYQIRMRVPDINVRATGTPATRALKVVPQSREYTLYIGRPPLAKYALFTNHHFISAASEKACASGSGCSRITFTSNTKFTGPVHTNSQFNYQGNPTFAGPVTSAGCVAGSITDGASDCTSKNPGGFFYGTDFQSATTQPSVLINNDGSLDNTPNYSTSLGQSNPAFTATPTDTDQPVKWNSNYLKLPDTGQNQSDDAAQDPLTADPSMPGTGLSIQGPVTNMALSVTSITPRGSGTAQKTQQITYTTSAGTVSLAINANKQVFYNTGTATAPVWMPAVGTKGNWSAAATTNAAPAIFNGVVYVNGAVNNLNGPARNPSTATAATSTNTPPAIADFMKLNVTASGDVGITSDLRYENPPCDDTGACNNESAKNIFGIYSSTGDVNIMNKYYCSNGADTCSSYATRANGTYVPANVSIQAVLMAGKGRVTVNGYGAGPTNNDRGVVNLVGGVIENYYGAFGVTDGRGLGRNFVYDTRTAKGVLPPSFPTTDNWSSNFSVPIELSTGTQVQQSNADYQTNQQSQNGQTSP